MGVLCPGWESNPHWSEFESVASASWVTSARGDDVLSLWRAARSALARARARRRLCARRAARDGDASAGEAGASRVATRPGVSVLYVYSLFG